MRLNWLKVGSEKFGGQHQFKNLKNVTIDFDENEWITAVIGWNGTGKSNVLEALAIIFRGLIGKPNKKGEHSPPEPPQFSYVIEFYCHGKEIKIDADPDRNPKYEVSYFEGKQSKSDNHGQQELLLDKDKTLKAVSLTEFTKRRDQFLPRYVFGYYSGHSPRMHDVFSPYLEAYDDCLRNGVDPGLRRMFYAKPVHSQFALLAFILNSEKFVQDFLADRLGLDTKVGIESILFVLNQPPWKSKAPDGDPRFWMARGVVKEFLSRLYQVSLAPIRVKRRAQTSLWNSTTLEYLYLFVKDLESLKDLVAAQPLREFFRDLESTYVSEMIDHVRIRVKLKNNEEGVTFQELSEGEQQLLTVLGLLNFTAEEESLFLLDEPDTHLNPQWSVDYFKYLRMFVKSDKSDGSTSHIVLSTHNPLAVAELAREQVQILYRDPEYLTITSHLPAHDPRGMGYSGVVTSDMFGLASSLDKRTQRRLEIYRILATIKERTRFQELRFQVVQNWLEKDRFVVNQRDADYQRYLEIRAKLLGKEVDENHYRSLVKKALSLTADERERLAQQAFDALNTEQRR